MEDVFCMSVEVVSISVAAVVDNDEDDPGGAFGAMVGDETVDPFEWLAVAVAAAAWVVTAAGEALLLVVGAADIDVIGVKWKWMYILFVIVAVAVATIAL